MKPPEALGVAILIGLGNKQRWHKPGEVVSHLEPEVREVLKQLTSKDIETIRIK